jgi:hypothetical protein
MMLRTKEADMSLKKRKGARPPEAQPDTSAEGDRRSGGAAAGRSSWALDAGSRETQVPGHELESWKRVFLETGTRGMKSRAEPEERELTLARAKIGELMMRLELAELLIEKS